MKNNVIALTQPKPQTDVDIPQLISIAIKGLVRMFDPEKRLFCFRLRLTRSGLVREGTSHRYTIMALLGLLRAEASGVRSSIEVRPALDGLLEDTRWITNLGDLGLLLWLCALGAAERLQEVLPRLHVNDALDSYQDARARRTMELAWFLSGLSHGLLAGGNKRQGLEQLALATHQLLVANQGTKGIFGHNAAGGFSGGALRAHVGSFADQVYPIYALAKFGEACGVAEALHRGAQCAEAICRAQGSLGQWWWHYSSATGKTVSLYPVYAVHQHGMAPMALWALGSVTGMDYSSWIYKGLQWIGGNNALGFDMRDPARDVIWRSIFQRKYKAWASALLAVLGVGANDEPRKGLMVNFECRSYELGWLLYALASQNNPQIS